MKVAFLSLPLALLAGCATAPSAAVDAPVARLGGLARVGPLTVQPTDVLEDSRCPEEVQCVWAGKVIIRVALRQGRNRDVHDMTMGQPETVPGGALLLTAVSPNKSIDGFPRREAYAFTFAFEPAP